MVGRRRDDLVFSTDKTKTENYDASVYMLEGGTRTGNDSDGAEATLAAGILSSLQPSNVRLRRAVANLEEAGRDARYPLIFDPQTAGGLLASVPAKNADACVAKLKELGYDRTMIVGEVLDQSDRLEPITVRV